MLAWRKLLARSAVSEVRLALALAVRGGRGVEKIFGFESEAASLGKRVRKPQVRWEVKIFCGQACTARPPTRGGDLAAE